ncbi:MAG: TIGR03936 family radical SAM-associated protein [Actinobacteria bacterium]|nr:TIGR03936 family radical SAM-associated protein [Actinomycetota bacterium]
MIEKNNKIQIAVKSDLQNKIRFKFSKTGCYKYFSHLDMISILSRAVRRAGIRVKYSEGFNPKPKISFGPPTSLGIESHAEYGDIVLIEDLGPGEFLIRLNGALQDRLRIEKAVRVPTTVKSIMSQTDIIRYSIYLDPGRSVQKKNDPGISGTQGPEGREEDISGILTRLIMEESGQIPGGIYRLEKTEDGDSGSVIVLNLLGYAKILKDRESKIFKLGEFKIFLEGICEKYSIDIIKIIKEELYIMDGAGLITPFESV